VRAGQRAVGAREDYKRTFVFPFLAGLKKSGAANTVTQFLNRIQLSGVVEGMSPSTTGTGLRIGPTNELAANIFVTITQIIQRGGWEFRGICNVFEASNFVLPIKWFLFYFYFFIFLHCSIY
jgi:hypothetical protein